MFLSYSNLYDNNKIKDVANKIRYISPIVFHAPVSMFNPSKDAIIREIVTKQTLQTIKVAKKFNSKRIIFHTGYYSGIKSKQYLNDFIRNEIDFFSNINTDVEIALENVFEETPLIFKRIISGLYNKNIRMCLDIGHANLYSNVGLKKWINILGKEISHLHIHNNYKKYDDHSIKGSINVKNIIEYIKKKKLINNCNFSLEIFDNLKVIDKSIKNLQSILAY